MNLNLASTQGWTALLTGCLCITGAMIVVAAAIIIATLGIAWLFQRSPLRYIIISFWIWRNIDPALVCSLILCLLPITVLVTALARLSNALKDTRYANA